MFATTRHTYPQQARAEWCLDLNQVVFYCSETGAELYRRPITPEENVALRQLELPFELDNQIPSAL